MRAVDMHACMQTLTVGYDTAYGTSQLRLWGTARSKKNAPAMYALPACLLCCLSA